MRIALDARTIYRPTRRGTARNLIDLYRHLVQLRPDWEVLACHRADRLPPDVLARFGGPAIRPQRLEMPGDRLDAWERFRLPWAAWWHGAGVLHCPANTCPAWMPVPTVVTIHDLIPLDLPEACDAAFRRRFEQSVRTACRRAAWILCPSMYTRDRLIVQFRASPRRITVNPWAADTSMRPVPREQYGPVLARYQCRAPFVLHLGAADPRKNTRRLLEAWALTDRSLRRTWQLLVVGLDDATQAGLARAAASLNLGDSVRLCGFADEADLPALMSAADVLAYPSLAEGFGLPILDAWAAGTVVLTSEATSLPEVAGDAALLVDPQDTCAIARGLWRLTQDGQLRQTLLARSRQRLGQYTWAATAQRFAEVMERVAHRPRRRAA